MRSGRAFLAFLAQNFDLETLPQPLRELFQEHIYSFIETVRSELGNLRSPAVLVVNRHKAHMSDVIRTFTVEHGITLFFVPPQSSHLLQPLDQGSFRRIKDQFG
jgi:hypothetical protein